MLLVVRTVLETAAVVVVRDDGEKTQGRWEPFLEVPKAV